MLVRYRNDYLASGRMQHQHQKIPLSGDCMGTRFTFCCYGIIYTLYKFLFYLVGTAGFEPATHGLKGRCSTD